MESDVKIEKKKRPRISSMKANAPHNINNSHEYQIVLKKYINKLKYNIRIFFFKFRFKKKYKREPIIFFVAAAAGVGFKEKFA
jgi:hypothetical protein